METKLKWTSEHDSILSLESVKPPTAYLHGIRMLDDDANGVCITHLYWN